MSTMKIQVILLRDGALSSCHYPNDGGTKMDITTPIYFGVSHRKQ